MKRFEAAIASWPRLANLLRFSGARLAAVGVAMLIVAGMYFRLTYYGDIGLAAADEDTGSFIASSQAPLLSWQMLSGRRLLTTNLVYKAFEPSGGYGYIKNGSMDTTHRTVKPGYASIAQLQSWFSILSWGLLSATLAYYVRAPALKILMAAVVVAFAFVPQVADWDSLLTSESLTSSLFVLQLAVLTHFLFSVSRSQTRLARLMIWIYLPVYFFWTFARDTNLFACIAGAAGIMALQRVQPNARGLLSGTFIALMCMFVLGIYTSAISSRRLDQLTNIYRGDFFGLPARESALEKLGMPPPDSVEFESWLKINGMNTLLRYTLSHPGYPLRKIFNDAQVAFAENMQPYFRAPEQGVARATLIALGNTLHPESATPILIDFFLLLSITAFGWRSTSEPSAPWAWLSIWLMAVAALTLCASILGDSWALARHAILSTMIFRLFMWIGLVIVVDLGLQRAPARVEIGTEHA